MKRLISMANESAARERANARMWADKAIKFYTDAARILTNASVHDMLRADVILNDARYALDRCADVDTEYALCVSVDGKCLADTLGCLSDRVKNRLATHGYR